MGSLVAAPTFPVLTNIPTDDTEIAKLAPFTYVFSESLSPVLSLIMSPETSDVFPGLAILLEKSKTNSEIKFSVSLTNGFLPLSPPPTKLPPIFSALSSLLARMPIRTATGDAGLLATFNLGETLLRELPDLTDEVDKVREDLRVVGALYRDYCFLASAYLLEPCHERHVKGEEYGLGRQRLPSVLARPLARVAKM